MNAERVLSSIWYKKERRYQVAVGTKTLFRETIIVNNSLLLSDDRSVIIMCDDHTCNNYLHKDVIRYIITQIRINTANYNNGEKGYSSVTCSNSPPLYPDMGPFLPVQNYPTLEP